MNHSVKQNLRLRRLAARKAIPVEKRNAQDSLVQDSLRALLDERMPGSVAAYVPMLGEPGGPGLVDVLARQVPRLLLPVLLENFDLDWAVYDGNLAPATRGLVEPDGPRLGVGALAEVDLVIAPALAVARDGARLGRGGGSYDRALARAHPRTLVVTLLYEGEVLDSLPAESHDQQVSGAVTPSGMILFPAAPSR